MSYQSVNNSCSNKTIWAMRLISIYIIYNTSFVQLGYYIPRLSIVLLVLSLILTVIGNVNHFRFSDCKALSLILAFTVYSFLIGIVVSREFSTTYSQVLNLFETLVVGYILVALTSQLKKIDYISLSLGAGAVIMAIFLITRGVVGATGRMSINEDFNANTAAVYMGFGSWCIGQVTSRMKSKILGIIIMVSCSALLLYSIILTGSRKGLALVLLTIVAWLLIHYREYIKKIPLVQKIIYLAVLFLVVYFIISKYAGNFIESSFVLMERMDRLNEAVGEEGWKWGMIKDAFRVMSEHPMFGVGLDNNRYYSIYGMYAHNTYAELWACSGIIGTFLFYAVFVYVIKWIVAPVINRMQCEIDRQADIDFVFVLLLLFLFICFNQICMYNFNLMLILYTLIAYSFLNKMRINNPLN